ncbi:hypothetical protein ACXR2W_10495 [Leucobacter sp. HY1908]
MFIKNRFRIFAGAIASIGLMLGLAVTASPAMALGSVDRDAAAWEVYEKVEQAADPAAAVEALSASVRELFIYAVTPVEARITEVIDEDGMATFATCGTETVRGQGLSAIGVALYDFWTTGQICWNGGVSSATYLDGGGYSGAVGWNYTGSSSSQGIVGGWGYAAGTHYFEFNVAGVVVQSPVGCARVVGSPGGAHFGEVGVCGIG